MMATFQNNLIKCTELDRELKENQSNDRKALPCHLKSWCQHYLVKAAEILRDHEYQMDSNLGKLSKQDKLPPI